MLVETHNALDFYFILWQFKRILKSFPCVWVCVVEGFTKTKGKQKNHESTGPLEWALGLWYRQRKTTRSLVQYQTLHRREWFFLFYWFFLKVFFFFFPKWRHPITCGSWPFSLLEFLKVEKTVSFLFFLLSIDTCSLLYRSWNDNKCQLLHFFLNYSLIVSFFFSEQVTKEWSLSWENKGEGRYKNICLKKKKKKW